jgi:hypothetical protein
LEFPFIYVCFINLERGGKESVGSFCCLVGGIRLNLELGGKESVGSFGCLVGGIRLGSSVGWKQVQSAVYTGERLQSPKSSTQKLFQEKKKG